MTAASAAPPHPGVRWYAITHITDYHYSAPVTSSYGRGHLFPRTTATQRCLDATVTVSPTPTDASSGVDVQGNETVFFHVTTPHEHLRVTARSLVAVTAPDPALRATGAAAAPWEQSRPGGRPDAALDVEFALDLDPPEITADVREYAAVSFRPGRPLAEAVFDLQHRIHEDFTYLSGSTTTTTTVAHVMATRTGVCQDFARVAAACLRSQGLAARYVSGYLSTTPPPGKERLVGVDASHAWVSVRSADGRWFDIDPTNDQWCDDRYVTVARGRDYDDVPPLRGIIYTDSARSRIHVSVDVAPVTAPTAPAVR
ncbi:transglutaminase family protein [Rhodococcus kroppenstedtii]|uniref:transglutaminase family protein n=1 Tax=Rhodococcoides kroppenstedtii TaxID=293050 RepID=UPI00295587C1|nr:transglutaminase family protein [Rhodococcus kroppenstedtii]MDV7197721.1 transglutaminase family protein [Rhodococcus kroppenstedtii]